MKLKMSSPRSEQKVLIECRVCVSCRGVLNTALCTDLGKEINIHTGVKRCSSVYVLFDDFSQTAGILVCEWRKLLTHDLILRSTIAQIYERTERLLISPHPR